MISRISVSRSLNSVPKSGEPLIELRTNTKKIREISLALLNRTKRKQRFCQFAQFGKQVKNREAIIRVLVGLSVGFVLPDRKRYPGKMKSACDAVLPVL